MTHLFFSSFFFFKFSKYLTSSYYMLPGGSDGKESSCNARDLGSLFGSGRSPGEGTGPTPVFLPGKFHRQRNLVGYSSWDQSQTRLSS